MTWFRKVTVVLFSLCLFLSTVLTATIIVAASPSITTAVLVDVGHVRVDSTGALSAHLKYIGGQKRATATLTDEQTKAVIRHIPAYLFDFGGTNDFSLRLDDVSVNGAPAATVELFGPDAVHHMQDVKRAFHLAIWLDGGLLLALAVLIGFFIQQRRAIRPLLLRYSAYTYGGIVACAAVFCGWCGVRYLLQLSAPQPLSFYDVLWNTLHYLFFPFNAATADASFFNDALTSLLNVRFFLPIVSGIVGVVLLVIAAQLTVCAVLGYKKPNK